MQRRKRIDPRVIGSFVVGAVILSVAGLLFFGPGGFLSETRSYVIYFDSSVKGLNVAHRSAFAASRLVRSERSMSVFAPVNLSSTFQLSSK